MTAQGRFRAGVDASGAGKDSLINGVVAARPDLRRVRRVITRASDAGQEDIEAVSEAEFAARVERFATELFAMPAFGILKISHFLHLRAEICSETLVDEMGAFGSEDRVGLVSLMDQTPG